MYVKVYIMHSRIKTFVVAEKIFGRELATLTCTPGGSIAAAPLLCSHSDGLGLGCQGVECCHDSAFSMRYAAQAKTHLHASQSSGQHQIVEVSKMTDTKSFVRQLR